MIFSFKSVLKFRNFSFDKALPAENGNPFP